MIAGGSRNVLAAQNVAIVERRIRYIHVVGLRRRRRWWNVGAVRWRVPVRLLRWSDNGRSVWTLLNIGRSVKGARWRRHDDVTITNDSGRHHVSRIPDDRIVAGVRVVGDDD